MGRSPSSPSIADVARLAGVSPQTVSRVANDSDLVKPATRDRVLAAMAEFGYAPNRAARALRSGSFKTIGIIAHQISRTGESRIIEAVVRAARKEGYTVTLVDLAGTSGSEYDAAAMRLENQAIDGLVIIRAEQATPETLALPPGLPVIATDSEFAGHFPAVGVDQNEGVSLAVDHLLNLGHRTVHHLRGPLDSDPANQRATAWRAALGARGARVVEPLVGDWTPASGYRLGREAPRTTTHRRAVRQRRDGRRAAAGGRRGGSVGAGGFVRGGVRRRAVRGVPVAAADHRAPGHQATRAASGRSTARADSRSQRRPALDDVGAVPPRGAREHCCAERFVTPRP